MIYFFRHDTKTISVLLSKWMTNTFKFPGKGTSSVVCDGFLPFTSSCKSAGSVVTVGFVCSVFYIHFTSIGHRFTIYGNMTSRWYYSDHQGDVTSFQSDILLIINSKTVSMKSVCIGEYDSARVRICSIESQQLKCALYRMSTPITVLARRDQNSGYRPKNCKKCWI